MQLAASEIPLIEHLESLGGTRAALAFDCDGTLWSGDVGEDFFEYGIKESLFHAHGAEALLELGRSLALAPHGGAPLVAAQLLAAYRTHQLPELTACEMMTWAFGGFDAAELAGHVERCLALARLSQRVFEPARRVIAWARACGFRVIAVSASPRFVIETAVAPLGITTSDIAACTLVSAEGRYLTTLSSPCPYGPEKVVAAEELLQGAPLLAAFGDSGFDFELLRSAVVPVAVRPKPTLQSKLGQLSGAWVLHDDARATATLAP